MDWYYAHGGDRIGPLTEEAFKTSIAEGAVTESTLVWRDGMDDWVKYGDAVTLHGAPSVQFSGQVRCIECSRLFPVDEVIEYAGSHVCGECKAVFFQRVKEGGAIASEFQYGGFWIRFAAKILDNILTSVAVYMIIIPMQFLIDPNDDALAITIFDFTMLISYGLPAAYVTFFLGRFGATPGKMAAGLKVVRPDGSDITYMRAFGRYFAEILSGIILAIGYIIAAFDDEKRALHDHICDTRVIRTR